MLTHNSSNHRYFEALFFATLVVLCCVRLWYAAHTDILGIEAYYWLCSERLDLAFFDGPAGTALITRVGTSLLGLSSLGIRLFFPGLALVASILFWALAKRYTGSKESVWAAFALNALPYFNHIATHAGPDMPALVGILAAALCLSHKTVPLRIPWMRYATAGFAVAFASQFRTVAILSLIPITWMAFQEQRSYRTARSSRVYALMFAYGICLSIAALGVLPQLVWNIQNDWPILGTATLQTLITPNFETISHALWIALKALSPFAPLLCVITGTALLATLRKHTTAFNLLAWATVFLVAFTYLALRGQPAPMMALLTFSFLFPLCLNFHRLRPALQTASIWIISIALPLYTAFTFVFPMSMGNHDHKEVAGARALVENIDRLIHQDLAKEAPFVITNTPQLAALLPYWLAIQRPTASTEVFLRESQDLSNQFGLWPRYDDFVTAEPTADALFTEVHGVNPYLGRNAIYVTNESPKELPQTITGAFQNVAPIATLTIQQEGGNRSTWHLYRCTYYQTMPL